MNQASTITEVYKANQQSQIVALPQKENQSKHMRKALSNSLSIRPKKLDYTDFAL